MSGRYGSYVAALGGLIALLGAAHSGMAEPDVGQHAAQASDKGDHAQGPSPTEQGQKAAQQAAATEQGCGKPESPINSRDCAEIRSAAASEAQARAARDQVGLGLAQIIGIAVSLIIAAVAAAAAIRAAIWARRAALHTKESADTAAKALAADQRPWLSMQVKLEKGFERAETQQGSKGLSLAVGAIIKNHGRAPATNVRLHVKVHIPRAGDPGWNELLRQYMSDNDEGGSGGQTLFGDEPAPFSKYYLMVLDQQIAEGGLKSNGGHFVTAFVLFCVNYESSHVQGICQTGACYHLCDVSGDYPRVFRPDESPHWWKKEIGLVAPPTTIAT